MSRNDMAGRTVHSTRSSAQQAPHRALQDQRRPGYGVEDLAVLAGCGDEAFGDLGVHVGKCVGRLVHIVERGRCTDQLGRRMSRRANESMR